MARQTVTSVRPEGNINTYTLAVLQASVEGKTKLVRSLIWRNLARATFGSGETQWICFERPAGGAWCQLSSETISENRAELFWRW
jgi:hypothetical protein